MHRLGWAILVCLSLAACSRRAGTAPGEGCLLCHGEMTGFAEGHDPAIIGCASCHLGNPDTRDEKEAHAGMVRIPGNLEMAGATCGTTGCHPGIDLRVRGSLMNTMRGVVSVDRFVFGENPTPDGEDAIQDIGDSPADTHLRNLCASCHLGAEKSEVGPVRESSRGGGCLACHLKYDREALRSYALGGLPSVHPRLSLQVSNQHCFGCHSRSGRIATSYEGWHETLIPPAQAHGRNDLRILEDGRVFQFIEADAHHAAGLDCIDCHDSMEVMGDGQAYRHKEDAVAIACDDCHRREPPSTRPLDQLGQDEQRMVRIRGQADEPGEFLVMQATGRTLTNTRVAETGESVLLTKNRGTRHPLAPPADACSRGLVHQALSCSACHTAWAPQCISCHTTYAAEETGYDLLDRVDMDGRWDETPGHFLAGPPTLGVREEADGVRRILPFVPGMILELDPGTDEGGVPIHHRLFAPAEPHTTTRQGRTCKGCHLDPVALGYGRGTLVLGREPWSFQPEFPLHPADSLPLDAWVPFLGEATHPHSTRTNTRPFSVPEQSSILRVGTCLSCHEGSSTVMQTTLMGMQTVTERMPATCRGTRPTDPAP